MVFCSIEHWRATTYFAIEPWDLRLPSSSTLVRNESVRGLVRLPQVSLTFISLRRLWSRPLTTSTCTMSHHCSLESELLASRSRFLRL